MTRFYINRTGNAEGPHDEATIVGMISRGEFPQGHICPEGGQAWQSLDSHPPFAQALSGGGPSLGAAPAGGGAFGAQPSSQPFGAQPSSQPFGAQPSSQPFGAQPSSQQPFGAAAHQVATGAGQAAHGFGQAISSPQSSPLVSSPSMGAAGDGFFEQARARNEPIPDSAMAAAGQAHLFGGGGAFISCGTWGGPVGAFVANVLYKDQPKHPFALFHINQALLFHGAVFVFMIVWSIVSVVLTTVLAMIADILGLVGNGLYLVSLLVWIGAIALSFIQMGKAKKGEWSELPIVGKRVMAMKTPLLK